MKPLDLAIGIFFAILFYLILNGMVEKAAAYEANAEIIQKVKTNGCYVPPEQCIGEIQYYCISRNLSNTSFVPRWNPT